MRQKTMGVVFSMVPYNDKISFVNIYTRHFGRVCYAVPNVKGKRSKLNRSVFAPFTILELEVEHYPDKDIHKIHEVHLLDVNLNIVSDPVKSAVTLFLAEFLTKAVREQEENASLYNFLADSIRFYNLVEDGKANFHLVFMNRIADFLGFRINADTYRQGYRFNMLDGVFTSSQPDNAWFLQPDESYLFYAALKMGFADMNKFQFNREQRSQVLDVLVSFYRLHLPDIKEIKSLDVLKELFS